MKKYPVILCLGSNVDQADHIDHARRILSERFDNVRFTRNLWTEPVGPSPARYLNCLAALDTKLSYSDLNSMLKGIEQKMGRNAEDKAKHLVKIDIDILKYDHTPYHLQDWERSYVKKLMKEIRVKSEKIRDKSEE